MRRAGVVAGCLVLAACATAPVPVPASPTTLPHESIPSSTARPSPEPTPAPSPRPSYPALSELVEATAMGEHLEALQAVVDDSPSGELSRATGTVGFEESARYVQSRLSSADYVVDRQELDVGGIQAANLIVELPGTSDDVLMLGAHLDSVAAGPGINDNASGVAALLEVAKHLRAGPRPHLTVRFAFWAAEEGGPFGSQAYVASLQPAELERITAYLNFDMLASPNAVRFVYDEAGAAPGSEALTQAFGNAFDDAGLAWEPIDLDGDSDHGPFAAAGIPTGGLFSGGIEPVTEAQAATFDAVAGEPADPCGHRACDTIDNVDLSTLEQMADAIAAVVVSLAVDPSP